MIQPGGVFSGERNAYKCKQSHLRAAEKVAQFSFTVGHWAKEKLSGFFFLTVFLKNL